MSDEELIKETMMLDYSQLVMHNVYMIKENNRLNNIINELAFIFDDYNEFNEILEKYSYELKGSDKKWI